MGLTDWISKRIEEAGAYRESDTERDGTLSYSWEWHAVGHGLYLGLVTKPWRHPPQPTREDVQKESHYYRGAYLLGTSIQWAAIGVLAYLGYTELLIATFGLPI